MSLKAIHIVFIVASMAMTLFLGIWSLMQYLHEDRSPAYLAYIGVSAVALVALAVYGRYFLKKLKNISYL